MSSTKARYSREKQVEEASAQKGTPTLFGNDHHTEPTEWDLRFEVFKPESLLQTKQDGLRSNSRFHWNEDETPEDDTTVLWRVMPDYGEKDAGVVHREEDITMSSNKKSGWTNPLGWHDNGDDDDKVVLQLQEQLGKIQKKMFVQYDESEGPTKEDNGENDNVVVYRENDVVNGKKFHGWTNPLSWADAGNDDDTVLAQILLQQRAQMKYDESEGPTKEDNGELDNVVVYRENDVVNGKKFHGWTNPLSWADAGNDDDTVLTQYDESEGPTKEDNGELDNVVVYRENDVVNGKKFYGWTNPLSWTDAGNDDDTVL